MMTNPGPPATFPLGPRKKRPLPVEETASLSAERTTRSLASGYQPLLGYRSSNSASTTLPCAPPLAGGGGADSAPGGGAPVPASAPEPAARYIASPTL